MVLINGRKAGTVNEARELADVSRRTIYNWMDSGKVEWFCTASGRRRIYVDTLFKGKDGGAVCFSTSSLSGSSFGS